MPRFPHTGRRRRAAAALAVLVLLPVGVAACSSPDGPDKTVDTFLSGWRGYNLDKVGFVGADGAEFPAQQVVEQLRSLSGDLADTPPAVTAKGEPSITGELASGEITVDWKLPSGASWSYPSTVKLTKHNSDGWRVIWEPSVVHPDLTAGDKLALRRVPSKRAGILDAAGQPLVTPRPVVTIGVYPEKIEDLPSLTKDLDAAFKKIDVSVDLKNLKDRVDKADDTAFIELVTLRRPDYNKIRDDVRDLAGTVFREENRDLAPTRVFARALLGTADAATKDDLSKNPDTLVLGDVVGHGGLQQQYDTQLRGTPGQSVVIAREAPDGKITDTKLFATEPVAGVSVKTTLDVTTQNAADKALAQEKQPSSMVAIRIKDSAVLAVANGPDGGGADPALTAQVPPGSTFKMVSALALLEKKAVTLDASVDCPKTVSVEGKEFKNSHDMELGKVPFRTIFAKSCNTGFVNLAPQLGEDGLAEAGTQLGLGAAWNLGIDAFSGKVATGGSKVDQAAASFGQGTTVVSPLAMAGATAAVARGEFLQPQLVLDPAPPGKATVEGKLPADAVGPLKEMMREVVTKGTGTALRTVPGGPVYGKTGTAEFDGSEDTHAWFIGWQGDIAFAVLVEKGGAGADTAVPIVKRFLTTLAG
jgi:cell division protein FtsI/penicillin-binding protein 2